MSLLPASVEFVSEFPSPRHLSSSGSYPLDLSSLGDPTGSNATTSLALWVTGTHKPLQQGKVEIPLEGFMGNKSYVNEQAGASILSLSPVYNFTDRILNTGTHKNYPT
jgi:hypothetical protein